MARVLIIDDSEVIRNLLREFLAELGYEVNLATDGREGLTKALTGDYTVIFCDVHMPMLNGYDVFRKVTDQKPGTVFIMTDSLPDELSDKAIDAGAQYCLTKPFDLDQVREILQTVRKKSLQT